jgi:glyoxylase-like metal-dependent hydrolase (beta-lactamase superfamily II)
MAEITYYDDRAVRVYFIKDRSVIIADTGRGLSEAEFRDVMKANGVEPADVKLIIITHAHWDHYSGTNTLKKMTGASVLCHKNAVPILKEGDPKVYIPRNEDGKIMLEYIAAEEELPVPSIEPDIVLDLAEGDTFDISPYGVDGKIVYTPGHSNCSISIILNTGEALVGDVMLNSLSTGKPCLAIFGDDDEKLNASVKYLLKNADTYYGGHGGPYKKEEIAPLIE